MKKIIILMVLASIGAFADAKTATVAEPEKVRSSYGYIGLGLGPAPFPLPIFSGGWRMQSGHNGLDLSLDLMTLGSITGVQENIAYLHYFKPNLASQFYVGGGIGIAEVFFSRHRPLVYTAPQFIFGKQYTNEAGDRRFFQTKIEWPTVPLTSSSGRHIGKYPLVTFSYGICF